MIAALLLATALFLLSVASHLVFLKGGTALLERRRNLLAKLGISLLVLCSHLLVAIYFAVGLWLGSEWGMGGFKDIPSMGRMDYFYFSLVNMTTLGLGDIYPTEHLRAVTGIQALAGFALISCSAQLFWKMMTKGDDE